MRGSKPEANGMMRRRQWVMILMGGVLALALTRPVGAAPLTVFGAASLTDALEAVGRAYEEENGEALRFSFAASSRLARQIAAGAPADIYASAHRQWMDYLNKKGLIDPRRRKDVLANRLVLIAPADSDVERIDPASADGIADTLGASGRLAMGDPAHVPAGIYAQEALETLGHWPRLEARLARTDDVRAAVALVARGEAPLGIVYKTDARVSDDIKIVGTFSAASHTPITYPIAVVTDQDRPAVRRLFDFLTSDKAMAIFRRYGFSAPAGGAAP